MFKNNVDIDVYIRENNLALEFFVGRTLEQIKFKESGNSFLFVFSDPIDKKTSTVQLANCFVFKGDVIPEPSVSEVYIKRPGVFVFEYCNRHGINASDIFEFDIFFNDTPVDNDSGVKSMIIGFERIIITEMNTGISRFWEI